MVNKPKVTMREGKFYVLSSDKTKVYTLDCNLQCNCKGYMGHRKCCHQKDVIDFIMSGKHKEQGRDNSAMFGHNFQDKMFDKTLVCTSAGYWKK